MLDEVVGQNEHCPKCGSYWVCGHKDDCELGKLLKELADEEAEKKDG